MLFRFPSSITFQVSIRYCKHEIVKVNKKDRWKSLNIIVKSSLSTRFFSLQIKKFSTRTQLTSSKERKWEERRKEDKQS